MRAFAISWSIRSRILRGRDDSRKGGRVAVPFVDLKAQYRAIKLEVDEAIRKVIEDAAFVLGPAVERFESDFARYLGVDSVVGTSNGTTALQLSLLALGVGEGDEVIVPAHTFIATAEAVSHVGARPVLVDVCEDTGNLDPAAPLGATTTRTRAIIPVHLYGQPADLDPIIKFAESRGIAVLEDACQAHGAAYRGVRVGSFGAASCFSFYPGKNLGAYGEAGAVATNDPDLAARVRRLRDHGQSRRYYHAEVGYNARMEGIQGAVLGVKLRHLDAWNRARAGHAAHYSAGLSDSDVEVPVTAPDRDHVFHLYVVRSPNRDELRDHLTGLGVQTGLHYPVPLHLQPAYEPLKYRPGDFPVAERWAQEGLSLPIFPEMKRDQLDEVILGVKSFRLTAVPQPNNR
ncbi:MAG: DegT/DnrJ/EryC1/StrS family aminotransferase [Candidatus Eisenbacteria bacterium]|uniref:DegT/DnrJ/EryC1/StrS family aminotransferase n=1 Tax=Eiseniibacteriota bacterium TaxID=2212470 RepID=A0A538TPJ5_UNCEI|nr:MAG: DegT/DnrJ/EryC1/StrS family aminotransferase [Candidatus Eisenbacteria bacterium]